MFKKLLTGILITFGVLFLLGFLADRYFFRNNEDYPAELIDFQPKDLNINGGGPFFIELTINYFTRIMEIWILTPLQFGVVN
jgi:hypothetical protein